MYVALKIVYLHCLFNKCFNFQYVQSVFWFALEIMMVIGLVIVEIYVEKIISESNNSNKLLNKIYQQQLLRMLLQ